MIIVAGDPISWEYKFAEFLQSRHYSVNLVSVEEFFAASWDFSLEDSKLVVSCALEQSTENRLVGIVLFQQIQLNKLLAKLDDNDRSYCHYAWLSLLAALATTGIKTYNLVDLAGVRHDWRYIYSLVFSWGGEPCIVDTWNKSIAWQITKIWMQFSYMQDLSKVHLALQRLPGKSMASLILVHYFEELIYVSLYSSKGIVRYNLEPKYLDLVVKLLNALQLKMGTALFLLTESIEFVAVSPEVNWHYCWDHINNIYCNLLVSIEKLDLNRFILSKSAFNLKTTEHITIDKKLRPELQGGWVTNY